MVVLGFAGGDELEQSAHAEWTREWATTPETVPGVSPAELEAASQLRATHQCDDGRRVFGPGAILCLPATQLQEALALVRRPLVSTTRGCAG